MYFVLSRHRPTARQQFCYSFATNSFVSPLFAVAMPRCQQNGEIVNVISFRASSPIYSTTTAASHESSLRRVRGTRNERDTISASVL